MRNGVRAAVLGGFFLSSFVGLALAQEAGEVPEEWCNKCKSAERAGCKEPCAEEQGVKYFVCLDECSTKRCEMACTPLEPDPAEQAEQNEKERKMLCRACRRQSSKTCKDTCSNVGNGRKRARCKKKCVVSQCKDACAKPAEQRPAKEGAE